MNASSMVFHLHSTLAYEKSISTIGASKKEILLQKLEEGQRVDVLCLSFDTEPAAVASFSQ